MRKSCLLVLLHIDTLANYCGQSQKPSQQGDLQAFSPPPTSAAGLPSPESESEGRQTPLFYVCMHLYNCVCLCACVCRDPLPSYTHYRPFSLSHFRLMALYNRAGLAAGGNLAFDCLDAEHMWERTCSCPAESTSLSQRYKHTLPSPPNSLCMLSHFSTQISTMLYSTTISFSHFLLEHI